MEFHEVAARTLGDLGLDMIFGVLGDANLFMMDSFERQVHGRYVSMCTEAGAVSAANGFARASGQLGVATVTHGPGLTNAITALVESAKARTPLLLVAGDTAIVDKENRQNVSQQAIVHSAGIGFEQLRSPDTIAEDLVSATRRALVGRMPVVLNVPADFQRKEATYRPVRWRLSPPQAIAPDPRALDIAVGVIASARRPVVLAGAGAASAGGRESLVRLARRIGAPMATTIGAQHLFDGLVDNVGVCGTLAEPFASEVIDQCDCLAVFGASLNKWTTVGGSLLSKKKVVQVDVDIDAIGKYGPVDAGVIGDAATVADLIVSYLSEADVAATEFAARVRVPTRPEVTDDQSTGTDLDLRRVLRRLDRELPADRTLVLDAGRFLASAMALLHSPNSRATIHTVSYGSIGLGMANAIGASFGAPGRPVILVCGDGGFMLGGLAEFNSAVRHGVDLVVMVLNDGAYGAEYVQLRDSDLDPSISTFDWPDLGPVATSLGGIGVTVRNDHDFGLALRGIATRDRPALIDVRLDPDKMQRPGH